MNRHGDGRFTGYSAGSAPRGEVHPLALELLVRRGYDTNGLRSKSWDEFEEKGSSVMDFVFTVCDHAANEPCPVWPGRPVSAHWGLEDPAGVQGTEMERREAFARAYAVLEARVEKFLALPLGSLGSEQLGRELEKIGCSGCAAEI